MTKTDAYEKATRPDDDWVRNICKIGRGELCCRFLTVGSEGWSCAKSTPDALSLTAFANDHLIVAQADNCDGRAA